MITRLLALLLLVPQLALAVCTSSDAYSATICADSPTGYWRLNEPSGSTFTDSSGNGNNGTKVGSPSMNQTGPFSGSAGIFSGSTANYATFTNAAAFSTGTGDFTGEIWAKPDATGGPYHIAMGKGYSPGWDLEVSAGGACSGYCNGQFFCSTTNSANTWYHFVTRRTSTAITIHRNGSNDTQGSPTCNVSTNNSTAMSVLFIASFSDPHLTVSEYAFWNSSISTTRISAHYSCGATGLNCTSTGPVGLPRIFKSSWEPKRPPIATLLARGLEPIVIDEPFFIAERLNARVQLVAGQYQEERRP